MREGPKDSKPFSAKLNIRNCGKRPRVVWVEPLPENFTLLPGEELEIIVRDAEKVPSFTIDEWESATQVYPNQSDPSDYDVMQNGVKLDDGHNRQAAIDAGIDL